MKTSVCSFKNDYSDGGHPAILRALCDTAGIRTEGYGLDQFSEKAAAILKEHIGNSNIDIHFIAAGGILTNLTAIAAFLRSHEAVISASSGHINVHETGSIEASDHKIFQIETEEGKIRPEQIREAAAEHHFEHMVKPKQVYIHSLLK